MIAPSTARGHIALALLVASLCLSCTRVPAPPVGTVVSRESRYIAYGRDIIELAASGPARAGTWSGNAGPRDSFAFPGGCIAWDRATGRVIRFDNGVLSELGQIGAAELFLSAGFAVGRSAIYEKGRGFPFSVYKIGTAAAQGIERHSTFYLDCIPADAVFAGGRFYLAGAGCDDATNRLYEVEIDTGQVRAIAELPKRHDFGRVVTDGNVLWYYLSPALPRAGPREALRFLISRRRGASKPERICLAGLPTTKACPFGSAFAYNGRFWVPIASGGGASTRVSLASFDPLEPAPRAKTFIPLESGSYSAVGESGGGYWIFGFLYMKDPAAFSLVKIRGGPAAPLVFPLEAQ